MLSFFFEGNLLFLEQSLYKTESKCDNSAYGPNTEVPNAELANDPTADAPNSDLAPEPTEEWLLLPPRNGDEYSPPIQWGPDTTKEQLYLVTLVIFSA